MELAGNMMSRAARGTTNGGTKGEYSTVEQATAQASGRSNPCRIGRAGGVVEDEGSRVGLSTLKLPLETAVPRSLGL